MTDAKRPHRLIRLANLVFAAVGAVALVWMVYTLDVSAAAELVTGAGPWLAVIFGASIVELALNTAAIHGFMRPEQRMVSFWRVLVAQLSGQAVNYVTPTRMAGEVVKVTMLVGHAPRYRAVSSIVAYNVATTIATVTFLAVALGVCAIRGGFGDRVQLVILIAVVFLVIAGVLMLVLLRRGLLSSLAGAAHLLRLISTAKRDRVRARMAELDEQLAMFRAGQARRYWPAFVYIGLARIVSWLDLWLLLAALGHPHSLTFVIVAAGAGIIIGTLAGVVPLGIGADDGGQAGLFALMGSGAAVGLSVSLVRRARTVVLATLGLATMTVAQVVDRASRRRAARALRRRVA